MTDRISEIKSLLETLSLKLASELQSQREEIEELRVKVAKLEKLAAAEPKVMVVEKVIEREEVKETVTEIEERVVVDKTPEEVLLPKVDSVPKPQSYVSPTLHASSPVIKSEESIFTVTDLKDIHNGPKTTISDLFAPTSTIADVARGDRRPWMVDIPGPKVEMIQSALTFNDRLTFIRDLFDGDSEQFNITLDRINETSTFDEVVSDMRDAYPEWDEESDLVYRFYMEVRRRFRD